MQEAPLFASLEQVSIRPFLARAPCSRLVGPYTGVRPYYHRCPPAMPFGDPRTVASKPGALDSLRVLDLTDERAIYGAKMLADLGAEVIRPEPPDGDPLRRRGPHRQDGTDDADGAHSLWHAFFASSRRFVALDPNETGGNTLLRRLVDRADVVLTCTGAFGVAEAHLDEARRRRPELTVVEVSSFGPEGPWRDYLAPDLVAGALGGAVATTGDADTPPLKTFGELNFILSGAYAAIAALAALYRVRDCGAGQRVHVPVHECIASCLEHVLMWYWYHDRMPNAAGAVLERRGSLHWSNAYVVMPAKGGMIMVTPTPNFDNQLVWLVENDAQEDLLDPDYQEPGNRRAYIRRFMEVLRDWVAPQDVEALFFEAQDHHAPYGWVLSIDKVAENPQLEARGLVGGLPVEFDARARAGRAVPVQRHAMAYRPLRRRRGGYRRAGAVGGALGEGREHRAAGAPAGERPRGGPSVDRAAHPGLHPRAGRAVRDAHPCRPGRRCGEGQLRVAHRSECAGRALLRHVEPQQAGAGAPHDARREPSHLQAPVRDRRRGDRQLLGRGTGPLGRWLRQRACGQPQGALRADVGHG